MKTITTLRVNCQDCHRCVRTCPVKAIGIERGHAHLVEDKCILCGNCVVECPQHAKQVQNQIAAVMEAFDSGKPVILSLAPSFVASFTEYSPEEFFMILKVLGFTAIEETAVGAEIVSKEYEKLYKQKKSTTISSCCPVIVNLVEKYYPQLIPNLADVVSPMVAHARMLKEKYGNDAFVVFAGPCIAKIAEADNFNDVDAAITFVQLKTWIQYSSDIIKSMPSLPKDILHKELIQAVSKGARFFPIAGGIIKSFMTHDETDTDVFAVNGLKECIEVFDDLAKGDISPRFIEALACRGGCIGGPGSANNQCRPLKKEKVVSFALESTKSVAANCNSKLSFKRTFSARHIDAQQPTEAQIREILRKIGKNSIAEEKNCGACGYNSCREKAVAIFQGLAEPDMCVPYMRSRAESFANIIVDNSENAIIVVDDKMTIQEFNPAAQKMFQCDKMNVQGKSLTEIMDCAEFFKVATCGVKVIGQRVEYPNLGLVTEQTIIPVQEHNLVIGIITNITDSEKRNNELQSMKLEAVDKAKEIINKQMHVAQEIAGLLGETTAETKAALFELIQVLKG